MFKPSIYSNRRSRLFQQLNSGVVLLLGNELSPMNCRDNVYPFRQDSSFSYFFGVDLPHMAAILDLDKGESTLFGDDPKIEDIVWTGPQPSLAAWGEKSGVAQVMLYEKLSETIAGFLQKGRKIHLLPPYRPENRIQLSKLLSCNLEAVDHFVSVPLIQAVVAQRAIKSAAEIMDMERAVNTTGKMHVAAMQHARAGMVEAELAGLVEGIAVGGGGQLSYPVILTVNGQTLHNHHHHNVLQNGQLVLGDFGAETALHYAGDITRTFPVDQKFTNKQKEIYEIVLKAEVDVIQALKPGIRFLDMHKMAARIISNGLKDLGIMKGNPDEAVEAGAHALFFPHGLGHMIGLDVHDMEDLGEDYVGYADELTRDPRFGYKSLRLARTLEPGYVLTVEPGIYFIPELIQAWRGEGKFKDFINYEALDNYMDFSGIRIEDNILITETGHRILGDPIPKTVAEVEALRS